MIVRDRHPRLFMIRSSRLTSYTVQDDEITHAQRLLITSQNASATQQLPSSLEFINELANQHSYPKKRKDRLPKSAALSNRIVKDLLPFVVELHWQRPFISTNDVWEFVAKHFEFRDKKSYRESQDAINEEEFVYVSLLVFRHCKSIAIDPKILIELS